MTAPRRCVFAMGAAVLMAGCSGAPDGAADRTAPTSAPASSSASSAGPTPTPSSAFCLDLSTFQVGVVAFRADVGKAIEGEPLDFEELRLRADAIARMGKEMRSSAPPDIAEQFRAVLKAIDTSASGLKRGAQVRDVVDPLYGEKNAPSFDAVDDYDCGAAGE
ncbi:hypothetical protein [Streptomyces sp. NPDC056464]|uniref:hypothetical protein n=1 Tax=Streptomyces sp. NPDC056464 TaxID=3345828 RepID=UPI0036A0788C